jgi:hypothetical protein
VTAFVGQDVTAPEDAILAVARTVPGDGALAWVVEAASSFAPGVLAAVGVAAAVALAVPTASALAAGPRAAGVVALTGDGVGVGRQD